ncbi:hypothetical protein B0H19DRAFT_1076017 [Mycena capillaripes]|nr:hypothetical protein B0H19DRAFT_1076017 [Mycena capillaripes]
MSSSNLCRDVVLYDAETCEREWAELNSIVSHGRQLKPGRRQEFLVSDWLDRMLLAELADSLHVQALDTKMFRTFPAYLVRPGSNNVAALITQSYRALQGVELSAHSYCALQGATSTERQLFHLRRHRLRHARGYQNAAALRRIRAIEVQLLEQRYVASFTDLLERGEISPLTDVALVRAPRSRFNLVSHHYVCQYDIACQYSYNVKHGAAPGIDGEKVEEWVDASDDEEVPELEDIPNSDDEMESVV